MTQRDHADRNPRLYLASPLFTPRERDFNVELKESLRSAFDVYLPQEDGLLLADLVKQGIDVPVAEKMVFDADIASMSEVDALLAVLDGATVDEGVAFEIGYVHALGKTCVALQTDIRRQLPTGNNPMIGCSISQYFEDVDSLILWARGFSGRFAQRQAWRFASGT